METEDPDGLRERIETRFGVTPQVLDGGLRIESEEGHNLMAELYPAFRDEVESITLGKPTLEDVFIHLTGHRFLVAGEEEDGG